MPDEDNRGPPVDDSEDLYRAILHPDQWAAAENRPSSAAFKSVPFSVDIASRTTPQQTADRFPGLLKLVTFQCAAARQLGFDARDERDPLYPENTAHANVYYVGSASTATMAKRLAKACRVVEV